MITNGKTWKISSHYGIFFCVFVGVQHFFVLQVFVVILDPLDQPDVGGFINGRLNDADDDPSHTPGDEMLDFANEGGGSDAGSLSSINTDSSLGDENFDHLRDLGPKFSRLADMYSGGDDEDLI